MTTDPTQPAATLPAAVPAAVPAAALASAASIPTDGAAPAAASAGRTSGRLRPGELRRLVAGVLAEHPGSGFSAGEVARELPGRSAGAIANALATLADQGAAEQCWNAPVRYRSTPDTASAATPSHPPAPSPSPAPSPPPAARTRKSRPATARATTESAARGRRTRGRVGSGVPTEAVDASATPAGPGRAADPVTGPVTRPNGQTYHPRRLGDEGMPDVTALRRLREAGIPALMYGPPGTGKTSVIEAAFPDAITVQGDGDTTVGDLVGEYTQTPDGTYRFVHGPLVRAMREGRALFLDDATLIPPTVLAVVYPAMDGRREIVIKAHAGEAVRAVDGFYVAAGHNPGVHGAVLSDALGSRFSAQIRVSTDYDLAAQLKVDRRAVRVARNLATRVEKGEIGWAPQLRELLAFQKIAGVLGPTAAAANLVGIAPEDDRETVASVVRTVFGTPVEPLALGARIDTPTSTGTPIPTTPATPATPTSGMSAAR